MATTKAGRNKIKCQNYASRGMKFINKLRRVKKNSGEDAAKKYEAQYK